MELAGSGRAPTAAARGGRHRPRRCRWPRPMEPVGSGRAPTAAARGGHLWLRPCRLSSSTGRAGSGRAPTAAAQGDHPRPCTRRSTRSMELVGSGRAPTAAARGGIDEQLRRGADQQREEVHPTAGGGQLQSWAMEQLFAYTAQAQGGRDGLDLNDHRRTRSWGRRHRFGDRVGGPKRRANALACGKHARHGMRLVDRSQHHGQGVVGHAHEVAAVAGELGGQFAPEHSGRRRIGGAARRGAAQRGAAHMVQTRRLRATVSFTDYSVYFWAVCTCITWQTPSPSGNKSREIPNYRERAFPPRPAPRRTRPHPAHTPAPRAHGRTLRTRPFRKCSVWLVTEVWPVFERSKLSKLNTRSDQVQSAANSTRTTNKSRAPRVSGHHSTHTERSELSTHSDRTRAPGGWDPGARTCAPGQWGATCA